MVMIIILCFFLTNVCHDMLIDVRILSSSLKIFQASPNCFNLEEMFIQCAGQHEILASGPIEDLIAHREHR